MSNTIVTTDSETQKQSRLKDILRPLLPYLTISLLSSSEQVLEYNRIQATKKLAQSKNAKVITISRGKRGLPLVSGETSTD